MRSSDSQYAAAGTDPPWPPLLKGAKSGRGRIRLRGVSIGSAARLRLRLRPPPLAPPLQGGERWAGSLSLARDIAGLNLPGGLLANTDGSQWRTLHVSPSGRFVEDRPLWQTVDVEARSCMGLIALFRYKPLIRTRRKKKSGNVHNYFGLSVDRFV